MEYILQHLHIEIVLLSLFISIIGAFSSFELANRCKNSIKNRYLSYFSSTFMFGVTIWAMHLTGTLSFQINHEYDVIFSILTMLASFIGVSIFLSPLLFNTFTNRNIYLSGIAIGLLIGVVHYFSINSLIGIEAETQNTFLLLVSIFTGIFFATISLLLWNLPSGTTRKGTWVKVGSPLTFVVAVFSMHYIAFMAIDLKPIENNKSYIPVSNNTMALALAVATILFISTGFIISQFTRKEAERLAEQNENMYLSLFKNNQDGILVLDRKGFLIDCNKAVEQITGYTYLELLSLDYESIIHSDDIDELKQNIFDSLKGTANELHSTIYTKDGRELTVLVKNDPLIINGKVEGSFIVFKDITERQTYESLLNEMAFYDILTGIPNRRLFQDRLIEATRRAKRNNSNLALMCLDLDRFKWINDTLGHQAGDELLVAFTSRIQKCIRETDTLARLGGDEFAIIIDGYGTIEDVSTVAKRIVSALQESWIIQDNEFTTTSSIGIALYQNEATDMDTLLSHADKALYRSKERGRNTYSFYTEELNSNFSRMIVLEESLKNAITNNDFYLVYQPQIDIQQEKMFGAEVLLRYNHPSLGPVSPAEFIPICEKLGIIGKVTEWVMRESIKQQIIWLEKGIGKLHLAINISPTIIEKKSFLNSVKNCIKEFQADPTMLEFELVEYTFLENLETISSIFDQIKEIGIKISLDDFGSGYASLKYFKDLPFDKLKFDRSFMEGITYKEKDQAIIEAVLDMSNRLHFEVLCEGVETREQLDYLVQQGCKLVQGYYFSKPVCVDEFEESCLKNSDYVKRISSHEHGKYEALSKNLLNI